VSVLADKPTAEAAVTAAAGAAAEPSPAVLRWRPSLGGIVARVAVLAGLLGAVLAVPAVIPGVYVLVVAKAVTFALMALSMNVLMGYAGQVSLGHAAFLGIGAFAAAYVLTVLQLPFGLAVLTAVLLTAAAALVLGIVALRIRGLYLALVTIAFGLVAEETLFKIRALTGGGAGQPASRPAFAQDDLVYIYFGFALVAVVWAMDWRLTASKAGRAIRALRDNERVAASWGINVTAYKLLAFVISGAVAGLAGAYFAASEGIVVSASFTFGLSLTIVLLAVVGGLGSRPGVVQGGIVFAVLPTLLDLAHEHWSWWPFGSLWEPLLGALLLVLTLIFFPGGIAQQQHHLLRWLSFKRFHEPEHADVTPGRGDADAHA
jgi:branched-chain amino acid transport system permease protein